MWERELQILGQKLPQVRALDIFSLFNLDHLQNLQTISTEIGTNGTPT